MSVATLTRDRPTEEVDIELLAGGQAEFILDQHRHPAMLGGVGASKTFSNICKGFAYAEAHPGSRGLITEPTFPLVREVLVPSVREIFGKVEGRAWVLLRYSGGFTIQFYNESTILLRSALLMHPERLSGLNLAWFGMDEVALGDQEPTYKILIERIRQKGYPHQGWVTGTPKGQNWVFRRWGPQRKEERYSLHHVRTRDNKHLDADYLESLIEDFGDTAFAQQELEGLFVTYAGLIYPQFQTGALGHVQEPPPLDRLTKVVAGVDFGIQSPSVIEVYGRAATGRVHGLDEFYKRRCSPDELITAAGELRKRYDIARFYCDPAGKEEREAMAKAGLPIALAPVKDVKVGIQTVGRLLNRQVDGRYGIYFSPRQINQISEMYTYAWKTRGGSDSFVDEPLKKNDHCSDATRYALTALASVRTERPRQVGMMRV